MNSILLCLIVSSFTSIIINKIMATYYFKIIDSHLEDTIKIIKKSLLSKNQ